MKKYYTLNIVKFLAITLLFFGCNAPKTANITNSQTTTKQSVTSEVKPLYSFERTNKSVVLNKDTEKYLKALGDYKKIAKINLRLLANSLTNKLRLESLSIERCWLMDLRLLKINKSISSYMLMPLLDPDKGTLQNKEW